MPPQHSAQTAAQQQPAAAYKPQQSQTQPLATNTQYRASFPQLSPQMSPRSHQMSSPHPQMSPRPNVMSPAKQLQSQNVTNPLSPHPHMPSGPSPQPTRQQQQQPPQVPPQQPSKNMAAQSGSVSTLQALEQMVMPPSAGGIVNANAGIGPNMEYPPASYRPSPHQQHPTNPLSPMNARISTSPQHHQQWPPMNRSASASTMGQQHIYPQHMQTIIPPPSQQQSQMSSMMQQPQQQSDQNSMLLPQQHQQQQQMPPSASSQMNELSTMQPMQNLQPSIVNRNLTAFNIAELESKPRQTPPPPSQPSLPHHHQQLHSQDHTSNHMLQTNLTPNLTSMTTPVNMNPPDIQTQSQLAAATSSNANSDPTLLDPFAAVMEPIPPMVTPVSVPIPVSINNSLGPLQQHHHESNTHEVSSNTKITTWRSGIPQVNRRSFRVGVRQLRVTSGLCRVTLDYSGSVQGYSGTLWAIPDDSRSLWVSQW